jgi:hypothetical protein
MPSTGSSTENQTQTQGKLTITFPHIYIHTYRTELNACHSTQRKWPPSTLRHARHLMLIVKHGLSSCIEIANSAWQVSTAAV